MAEMLSVTVETKRMEKAFEKLVIAVGNTRPLWLSFGEYIKRKTAARIRGGVDPVTRRPWPARKQVTIATRKGGPSKGLVQSGALLRSWNAARVVTDGTGMAVSSRAAHARIHNRGEDELKPKRAKHLAIPLNMVAKRAGSASRWIEKAKSAGLRWFFFVSKKGNLILAYMKGYRPASGGRGTGRRGVLTVMFWLPLRVKIPRRRYAAFVAEDRKEWLSQAKQFTLAAMKGGR